MNMRKTVFAFATLGALALAMPAFADGVAKTSGDSTPQNATAVTGSGNGSNGAVGDNPNATAMTDICVRRTTSGTETKIVCPADGITPANGNATTTTN